MKKHLLSVLLAAAMLVCALSLLLPATAAEAAVFDETAYKSYDKLYYDEGNLVSAYDFFAFNAYWNADGVKGYFPNDTSAAGWESTAEDGIRYFDRFAVKGELALRRNGSEAPFTVPAAAERGKGGYLLFSEQRSDGDGFAVTGLAGKDATAEMVLRIDAGTGKLFSLSGFTLGIEDGAYTAPNELYGLTASEGIGAQAPLGSVATYSLSASNEGRGKSATLSLSVDGIEAVRATGTAAVDPTGAATFGQKNSFTGAVYALRYYRTALTDAQKAQNHFADIVKFYRIDLADVDLMRADAAEAEELYAIMADYGFDADRAAVQATYDSYRAAFLAKNGALAALRERVFGILTFEGYQVRVSGEEITPDDYAGMRAVFSADRALITALEGEGYTVTVGIRTKSKQAEPFFDGMGLLPIYDGERYVAEAVTIGELSDCFTVTALYARDKDGTPAAYDDARIKQLMICDLSHEYEISLKGNGKEYTFTYKATTKTFGDTASAEELYGYIGRDGEGDMQGSYKEDAMVMKMMELSNEAAVLAPEVGRLMLALGGVAGYTVTLPEGASADEREATEEFVSALSALSGATFTLTDEAGTRLDSAIVIANGSARADAIAFSNAAKAEELSYAIGVSGKSVLVYAKGSGNLTDALSVLLASVTNDGGNLAEPLDNGYFLPAVLSLKKDGATAPMERFTVVVPADMGKNRRAIVDGFLDALREKTGISMAVVDDTENVSGRRILVMTAAGDEAAEAFLADGSYSDYEVTTIDKNIVIRAYSDIALRVALATVFDSAFDEGRLQTGLSAKGDFGVFDGVPRFTTGGTLDNGAIYDANYNSHTASYSGVDAAEHLAYRELLTECGFVLYAENAINGNLFATYKANGRVISLAFYPSLSSMDITVTPEGAMLPSAEAAPYEKDPTVTPSVTLMDHELASYVLQLEDGSFLIVDGGDLNRAGAMDKMWDHLTSLTPAGQKPVISLWMITHAHSDHALLFVSFLQKYRDDLILKAVAYNFTNYELVGMTEPVYKYQGFDGLAVCAEKVERVLDLYYPNTERWIPRTGEVHSVAGAEIEILFSHEDHYPKVPHGGNYTSSGWRITLGGSTIVFLGDMTDDSCNRIAGLYGAALEADILQLTHHGVSGGSLALYQYIDPKICFWGTAKATFEGDKCNGTGDYASFTYNRWVRTTDWTRTVNGEEISGARRHYHGSVRTKILLPVK